MQIHDSTKNCHATKAIKLIFNRSQLPFCFASTRQATAATIIYACIFAGLLPAILPANTMAKQLPNLGNTSRASLSIEEEKLIGEMWMQKLRAANAVCNEPLINAYLTRLGQKLLAHADDKDFNFSFFCIEDHSINAFAFFGGHIGVHKGLILASQSENELAAAMAHEIAHATQHHLLRILIKNKQYMPITVAGALASTLLGVPDLAIPILATHTQRLINFTREHEQEADNIGMQLLADAGFDPHSMATLFARMSQQAQYNGAAPEYLLTHPVFATRISAAEHRADKFSYQMHPSDFNYHLIKALIEGSNPAHKQETLADMQERLKHKRYANQDAAQYGYAIALASNNDYVAAKKIMLPLSRRYPNNLIIQLGAVELDIASGQLQQALATMQPLLQAFPEDTALSLKYAATLIATNNAGQAKPLLLKLTTTRVPEPSSYQLLAQAENLTGNQLGMHIATAEWDILYGEYDNAIIQLNMALALAEPNVDLSTHLLQRKAVVTMMKKKQREL